MRGVRPRRGPLDESRYRTRHTGSAPYFTSRRDYDGLDAVVRRYPSSVETGETFVLVHGIGVSGRYFQPAAAELAKSGEVFLIDLPGFGSAPKPRRDVSISDHAGVLARFLRDAGLAGPIVVGHSMGSQVVAHLAVDHPDLTDRIVLMAPTMYPGYRTVRAAVAKLAADVWREPLRVKVIAIVDYLFRCGIPYFLRQLPHLLEDRIEDRVGVIRASTLVIRGDADVIVPADWGRGLAELAPRGAFTEVMGPHVVMFTDPVGVAAAIAAHANGDANG